MKRLITVSLIALLTACSDATDSDNNGEDGEITSAPIMDGQSGDRCPRVILESLAQVRYDGDTTGLPNLVTSDRLDWSEAPDDALAFTAPETGMYEFVTIAQPPGNEVCGASVWDFGTDSLYDESWCPAAGNTTEIDGFYARAGYPYQMQAGQTVIVWFSCTSWDGASAGPYTLTINKQ